MTDVITVGHQRGRLLLGYEQLSEVVVRKYGFYVPSLERKNRYFFTSQGVTYDIRTFTSPGFYPELESLVDTWSLVRRENAYAGILVRASEDGAPVTEGTEKVIIAKYTID